MIKRYDGNTGRVTHIPEPGEMLPPPPPPPPPPATPPRIPARAPFGLDLAKLLPGAGSGLETGDLLLLLILWLLYRESGDEELLIILGAMFLL